MKYRCEVFVSGGHGAKLMCGMQVVSTQMCNSGRTLCNSTAALIGPSTAVVEMKNTGTLSAWFTNTLDDCTHPIIPVPSQLSSHPRQAELFLDPDVPTEVVFEVPHTATSSPACSLILSYLSVPVFYILVSRYTSQISGAQALA